MLHEHELASGQTNAGQRHNFSLGNL